MIGFVAMGGKMFLTKLGIKWTRNKKKKIKSIAVHKVNVNI